MAYNSNIPQPADTLSQSQPLILQNFSTLAPWGNGYGVFTNQSSAPAVSGTDLAIYNATSSISSLSALFLKAASGTPAEFTTSTTATVSNHTESWMQLPSGVFIKWGFSTINLAAGANTFTFNATFPAFTTTPLVFLTPTTTGSADPNVEYYVQSPSTTSFQIYAVNRTGTGSATYYSPNWIAIGK